MPVVEIKLWKGRTREQKAEMAEGITKIISEVGKTAPEHVHI
ncbi:MAG TPA: 4-oxalocrotonate tautomerase, partial [Actinobacteria bacterium]|nr:4-oxalocrotonate tautomerase [Actinomycetes bacterium]HEX21444.1 4-oxalocrotonate tautomerase [Actinomycetota bacterium]